VRDEIEAAWRDGRMGENQRLIKGAQFVVQDCGMIGRSKEAKMG